mgnify:CR=1 FL=1
MAYSGVSITTAVYDTSLSSHCIPAYPQYNDTTNFNAAYYTERQDENQVLAGDTVITLVAV